MQTIILKDLKAQVNKVKRDARKLKKVQALQKENEEKERIKQKKVKEKEETKKKMIEEAKKKYEKDLRAVACDCTCYCALTGLITTNSFHVALPNNLYLPRLRQVDGPKSLLKMGWDITFTSYCYKSLKQFRERSRLPQDFLRNSLFITI